MQEYASDTDAESQAVQLEMFRRMSPQDRLQKALRLTANVRQMAMAAIQRRFPDYSEQQQRIKFIELHYGKNLAEAVQAYLRTR